MGLVESLTLVWMFLLIVPSHTFVFWIAEVDPSQICLHELSITFNLQVPHIVQLIVLLVNFWTVTGCTYIVLCSLTRLLTYPCIVIFWNNLGTQGEG